MSRKRCTVIFGILVGANVSLKLELLQHRVKIDGLIVDYIVRVAEYLASRLPRHQSGVCDAPITSVGIGRAAAKGSRLTLSPLFY
jgi:hypothetical protein